jgi:hypothetical protein
MCPGSAPPERVVVSMVSVVVIQNSFMKPESLNL